MRTSLKTEFAKHQLNLSSNNLRLRTFIVIASPCNEQFVNVSRSTTHSYYLVFLNSSYSSTIGN